MNFITTINTNWSLKSTSNCLTTPLFPRGLGDPQEWGLPTLQVLAETSALPNVDRFDFRAKLQEAIKARQARNKSAAGKVGYMTITDLRAVLRQYKAEEKESKVEEEAPLPTQAKGKGRATRSKKATEAEEEAALAKQPKARGRPRKNQNVAPKTPNRPIEEDEDDEEEEEEDSEAFLAGGKYQYLSRVRPVKVNLNPDASVAAKPPRKKPAPRAKAAPKSKKPTRDEDDNDLVNPRAATRPSIAHEDTDPRVPDDTGFLSPLMSEVGRKKMKKSTRLSRLQEDRIREPHWQQDMAQLESGHEDEAIDGEEAPIEDAIMEEAPAEDAVMEDADLEEVLQGLEDISDIATVSERLDMEELRLSMEQRIWRIKALRIQNRAEAEKGGQADAIVMETTGVRKSGRVLRKKKGKK
jgi:hypothetical protein